MGMGLQERSQRGKCIPELLLRNVSAAVLKGKTRQNQKIQFQFQSCWSSVNVTVIFFKPLPFLGFDPRKSSFFNHVLIGLLLT